MVEEERVVVVLRRDDLLVALAQQGQDTPVADVMRRQFQVVDAFEMLEPVFTRLGTDQCRTLPVTYDGRLVGLLTLDNIGEFLMIRSALRSKPLPVTRP